jgi:mevalonate kinase
MTTKSYQIPAKVLLFGEYGILSHYLGVAVTLPKYQYHLTISTEKLSEVPWQDESDLGQENTHKLQQFISQIQSLYPQKEVYGLIHKPFPKDGGFGNSSALLYAVHDFLFRETYPDKDPLKDPFFWEAIFKALLSVQGGGSGYDVAIQAHHCQIDRELKGKIPLLWTYTKTSSIPLVQCQGSYQVPGYLLPTGIYSSTAKALKIFRQEKTQDQKDFYALEQNKLAQRFMNLWDQNLLDESQLKTLMNDSLTLAKTQGIASFLEQDKSLPFPFKTLGSGYGDMLWILTSKDDVFWKTWQGFPMGSQGFNPISFYEG